MSDAQGDAYLHDLDPTRRFSDRAEDYVRFRPDYPGAAIDCVLAGLPRPASRPGGPGGSSVGAAGVGAGVVAADVGAGTGISARMLAERGVRVLAIEPNAEMRAAAAHHPLVTWRDGTAEATGLGTAEVDLLLCAQAFHWFRQQEALSEFHRVLRTGGRLALMWNARDPDDPLTRGYTEAIRAVNGEHPAARRLFDSAFIHATGLFRPAEHHAFPHVQRLDRAGLLGRARSASYVPREGARFEDLARRLNELFDRHRDPAGMVTLRYHTGVWISTRL